jgi:hypothetical protein
MTLTPSAANHAASDEPASGTRAAHAVINKRRVAAMAIWVAAFIGMLFVLGLPTDPVYAFIWLWALTIAWHSDRPWRSHLSFARDWAALVILLVLYNVSRGMADKDFAPHVTEMIHGDVAIFGWFTGGVVPTVWLQQHLYHARIQWYDVVVSFVYFSHFVTTLVVAAVLWMRNRVRWAAFIRRFVVLNVLGLATYFLYPAAPPWWAAERGLIQPLHDGLATRGWSAIGLHGAGNLLNAAKIDAANPVAAMPSLHSAYALIVVAFFLPTVRKRFWPLLLAYPLAMTFTLVYSGEHYMTDVLVGWFYVVVTLAGVTAAEKGWAAWQRRRTAAAVRADGAPVTGAPARAVFVEAAVVGAQSTANGAHMDGGATGAPTANGHVHGSPAANRAPVSQTSTGDRNPPIAWSADDDDAAEVAAQMSLGSPLAGERSGE